MWVEAMPKIHRILIRCFTKLISHSVNLITLLNKPAPSISINTKPFGLFVPGTSRNGLCSSAASRSISILKINKPPPHGTDDDDDDMLAPPPPPATDGQSMLIRKPEEANKHQNEILWLNTLLRHFWSLPGGMLPARTYTTKNHKFLPPHRRRTDHRTAISWWEPQGRVVASAALSGLGLVAGGSFVWFVSPSNLVRFVAKS